MATSTYKQPNRSTQNGTAYLVNIDGAFQVVQEVGAVFAVHEASAPNMTYIVDPGKIIYASTVSAYATQVTASVASPTVNPRYDRIVIEKANASVLVVNGAEAASPNLPNFDASTHFCLANCYVSANVSSLTNANITDERTIFNAVSAPSVSAFRGALAMMANSTSVANNSVYTVRFTSENYDTDAIHDTGTNPERLTVPAGVTKVRITGQAQWDVKTEVGYGRMQILYSQGTKSNGLAFQSSHNPYDSGEPHTLNCVTAIVSVVTSAYFTMNVKQECSSTSSRTLLGGSGSTGNRTWFSMEVIE